MAAPLLVTITFSHYCEKARWALERARITYRESGHLPVFHVFAVKRAGGKRQTPILVTDEGVIGDSTDIVKWADRRCPEAKLYGRNDEERREIEMLEERFDEDLGPHTRRWMYLRPAAARPRLSRLSEHGAPAFEKAALPVFFPVARAIMRRAMRITPEGAARSLRKIEEVFAEVDKKLADGRRYLVGDAPSVADITFASLAAAVVGPDEYGAKLPAIDEMPPEVATRMRAWREQPAGAFALRMFRDHRRG